MARSRCLRLPFEDGKYGTVVCGFGIMFMPDRQAALREARRVLIPGGTLLLNVWESYRGQSAFPGQRPRARSPVPERPGDETTGSATTWAIPPCCAGCSAGAGFDATRIETKRLPIECPDPRSIATGQIRGTPRAALIEQRGVAIDVVIEKVTEEMIRAGGNPYHGHAQAVIVEAVAT